MKQIDTLIVGGGLTGLTLAFYLKRNGQKVAIVEKSSRTGGVIDTITEDGFTFEKGPNTGIIGSPELVELFDDLGAAIEVQVANPNAGYRWIWKNGSWHALPSGLMSAVSTPLFSLKDKFRILGEPFRKPGNDPDECVADLVKRRLGQSFLDYAVDPFISGIYAGDPNNLVTRHALPKLYNLEQNYGSFIKGAIKKRKEPKTPIEKRVTREVFSVKGGLKQLVRALENGIGSEHIFVQTEDLKVNPQNGAFNIAFSTKEPKTHEILANKVVTTINGDQLHSILPFISKDSIRPISDLQYARVVQIIACYKKWTGKPLNAFGGLIPSLERRNALGLLFPSSLFDDRAPGQGAILSIFMGGVKKPELYDMSDQELQEMALAEVKETLESSVTPDALHIFRYGRAIPQYDIHSEARFQAIRKIEEQYKGLILAGNIRDGIGIPDRVKQAKQIALSL